MIKRFHSNLLYASNLGETAKFYERCGLPVNVSADGVRIKLGDFTLAFIDTNSAIIKNEAFLEPKGLGVYTYVEVDDVDAHYRTVVQNGVTVKHPPRDWPWGKREFAVKDPDGYKLVFYTPRKA